MSGAGVITSLGGQVHLLDTRLSGWDGITSAYLLLTDRPCLVETGTATSAATVVEAMRELGVAADDLATIVVTHIHLDHAGGVGHLARAFPNARVVVHESGARHLAEPERLLASARRVFGAVLDDVFGLLEATDGARIDGIGDRASIHLGGSRRLDAFHAPGHAQHHVGLVDSETGDLYVGDAAGIYVAAGEVRPATPPPDFDLDRTLASLDRFLAVGAQRLLFSHFGPTTAVEETLTLAAEEVRSWTSAVSEAQDLGLDVDHVVEMVRERRISQSVSYDDEPARAERRSRFDVLSPHRSNVEGVTRWLERHGERSGR